MKSYYDDPDKITFDEADRLVDRYINQYGDLRNRITAKHVASKFDVVDTHHNLIRINDALDSRLPTVRESGAKACQYKVEADDQ